MGKLRGPYLEFYVSQGAKAHWLSCLNAGLDSHHRTSFPLPQVLRGKGGTGRDGCLGTPGPSRLLLLLGQAFQDLRGESYFRTSGTLLLPITLSLPELQLLHPPQVSAGLRAALHTLSVLHLLRDLWSPTILACSLLTGIWSVLVLTPLICSLPLISVDTFQAVFPRSYCKGRDGFYLVHYCIPNSWSSARSIADT